MIMDRFSSVQRKVVINVCCEVILNSLAEVSGQESIPVDVGTCFQTIVLLRMCKINFLQNTRLI